jgi:hypothetical protein
MENLLKQIRKRFAKKPLCSSGVIVTLEVKIMDDRQELVNVSHHSPQIVFPS